MWWILFHQTIHNPISIKMFFEINIREKETCIQSPFRGCPQHHLHKGRRIKEKEVKRKKKKYSISPIYITYNTRVFVYGWNGNGSPMTFRFFPQQQKRYEWNISYHHWFCVKKKNLKIVVHEFTFDGQKCWNFPHFISNVLIEWNLAHLFCIELNTLCVSMCREYSRSFVLFGYREYGV